MKHWQVLSETKVTNNQSLIDVLLENRGIKLEKDKKEFIKPIDPMGIKLESLGVKSTEISKAIERIKKAKKDNEHVIIYGDYDADGITGTATLWETIHDLGIFVLPHIPERFSEGYGLNLESVKRLKKDDPKLSLIITVDHGITAGEKVNELKKMGIDMIITDHHQKGDMPPKPLALIYTPEVSGSALSWFFSREVAKGLGLENHKEKIEERLQLAAIGTIADQLPLTGPNRSVVKFGLKALNDTKRPGLLALFKEAGITNVGPYEVGFVIAPRINSMGRLKHGLESLRLLCTRDRVKAVQISQNIGKVNNDRQKIVEEVVTHALKENLEKMNVIVLSSESYHEGVIGLAAARLVEKFYRPAIVLSVKGDIAKASARSISGFNIIEAIRKLQKYYIEGGGHPMAAGFSIEVNKIEIFTKKINALSKELLTEDVLKRKLKIDCEIDFKLVNGKLLRELELFEPTGLGNPAPTFISKGVEIMEVKSVGKTSSHLKLKVKQDDQFFDSIFFGGGENYSDLSKGQIVDLVYGIEENVWNGNYSIQLKVKDLRLS